MDIGWYSNMQAGPHNFAYLDSSSKSGITVSVRGSRRAHKDDASRAASYSHVWMGVAILVLPIGNKEAGIHRSERRGRGRNGADGGSDCSHISGLFVELSGSWP
jgi:hypothetical protein